MPYSSALRAQLVEELVGQLIEFEMRAELHVPHPFLRQQPKQPRVRVAILDRVRLDAELQLTESWVIFVGVE